MACTSSGVEGGRGEGWGLPHGCATRFIYLRIRRVAGTCYWAATPDRSYDSYLSTFSITTFDIEVQSRLMRAYSAHRHSRGWAGCVGTRSECHGLAAYRALADTSYYGDVQILTRVDRGVFTGAHVGAEAFGGESVSARGIAR